MSGNVIKDSFLEKRGKFIREMIVLLYRFSKVAGLTCKLDNSNQLRKFSCDFFFDF